VKIRLDDDLEEDNWTKLVIEWNIFRVYVN